MRDVRKAGCLLQDRPQSQILFARMLYGAQALKPRVVPQSKGSVRLQELREGQRDVREYEEKVLLTQLLSLVEIQAEGWMEEARSVPQATRERGLRWLRWRIREEPCGAEILLTALLQRRLGPRTVLA